MRNATRAEDGRRPWLPTGALGVVSRPLRRRPLAFLFPNSVTPPVEPEDRAVRIPVGDARPGGVASRAPRQPNGAVRLDVRARREGLPGTAGQRRDLPRERAGREPLADLLPYRVLVHRRPPSSRDVRRPRPFAFRRPAFLASRSPVRLRWAPRSSTRAGGAPPRGEPERAPGRPPRDRITSTAGRG